MARRTATRLSPTRAKVIWLSVDTLDMDDKNTNNIGDTISIRRPPRVWTDDLGRTTWMGLVDACELQLACEATFNPYDTAAEFRVR